MTKLLTLAFAVGMLAACAPKNNSEKMNNMQLTQEWDKTFPQSDKVHHEKVTFQTKYGFTLVGDLYIPNDNHNDNKRAAIAVCGPFGAVKEQCSGLYAQTMAERGFIALAFDPSYTGESSGEPRRTASPDINTEDFMAAVDYLITRDDVDADRIGIIGICGWGGIALNAAAIDTRIKATIASTMYDMSRVNGNGYFDADDNEEARHAAREAMAAERTKAARTGHLTQGGGVVDPLPEEAPQFVKDYYDYYKTARGYHARSGNSNDGWHTFGCQAYANTRFLYYINEIRSAVLIMHGEKAHSRYFGEAAYKYMTEGHAEGYPFSSPTGGVKPVLSLSKEEGASNKELLIIPGASHCDLYDGGYTDLCGQGEPKNCIPWDKLANFFSVNMK